MPKRGFLEAASCGKIKLDEFAKVVLDGRSVIVII
jgi:hypothetical protein